MARTVNFPYEKNLVGVAEIAEKAGVSRQAVVNWQSRHEDFPPPLTMLKSGPVFMWTEVEKWLEATGRLNKKEK